MAGKRTATSDLNHDNWDKEEPPEDAGTFQRASEDSLKNRVIKTARRRNPISSVRDGGDGEKKSAFTSFSGFGKTAPPTSTAFTFLSNLTQPNTPPKVNGTDGNLEKTKNDMSTFKFNSNPTTSSTKLNEKVTTNVFATNTASNSHKDNNPTNFSPEKSNEYYSKLKGLNESVSNWIKKHVDANPLINLQPIFRDYEKYFAELEKEMDLKLPVTTDKSDSSSIGTFTFKPTTSVPDSTTEKFQTVSKNDINKTSETNAPKFSFGSSNTTTATSSLSFGNKASTDTGAKSLAFGSAVTTEGSKTTATTHLFTFGAKSPSTSTVTASETTKSINTTTSLFSFGAQPASKEIPSFSFGTKAASPTAPSIGAGSPAAPQVSFGTVSSAKEATKTIPSFSFGTNVTNSTSSGTTNDTAKTMTSIPSFSFGNLPGKSTLTPFSTSSPFTFASAVKPVSNENQSKDTEEDEEPPVNDFTPVVEKDHVYTIRCKVFVKKEDKFGDRGVGNLFLKPIPDSDKIQLIVRADTNLGNLLINLILSESIPIKRLGTKDVMLVCVPTPDTKPPPVPVLLRVKSSEEADTLLETLNKYKK